MNFFLHANWELLLSVQSEVPGKMNHHNCTHSFLCSLFCFMGGRDRLPRLFTAVVCCVCTSPQPSLNQEDRSEKRLRSTTSVFLLCVLETPDGCLSCSHANAGPGTMATAGPHMQKAEVSRRTEEVIGFLMAIAVVSWERPWLVPCAVLTVSRRGNVIFYSDDSGNTFDQRPRLVDRHVLQPDSASQLGAHIRLRCRFSNSKDNATW